MKVENFAIPDLIALYSQPYDAVMERWRLLGAIDKADHIKEMCLSIADNIKTVLEVGCGTGAVIEQLAEHSIGSELTGIEIGDERSKKIIQGKYADKIAIRGYDGKKIPYEDATFDFVYATHVLEHVTNERGFLHELRRVAKSYIYIEVPCELHVRTSYNDLQTSLAIGHINSYTPESFVLTLETSGLRVKDLVVYDHSFAIHRFHTSAWKAVLKTILRRSLLLISDRLASRIFTYHVGALCEKAPMLNIN
jgi:SAM-dependent methyltransferase